MRLESPLQPLYDFISDVQNKKLGNTERALELYEKSVEWLKDKENEDYNAVTSTLFALLKELREIHVDLKYSDLSQKAVTVIKETQEMEEDLVEFLDQQQEYFS